MSRLDPNVFGTLEDGSRVTCLWFARCQNQANGTREHPAFPQGVPICVRCDDKVERLR